MSRTAAPQLAVIVARSLATSAGSFTKAAAHVAPALVRQAWSPGFTCRQESTVVEQRLVAEILPFM